MLYKSNFVKITFAILMVLSRLVAEPAYIIFCSGVAPVEINEKSVKTKTVSFAKSRSRSQTFVLVRKNSSMPTNVPSKAYMWLMVWKRTS